MKRLVDPTGARMLVSAHVAAALVMGWVGLTVSLVAADRWFCAAMVATNGALARYWWGQR